MDALAGVTGGAGRLGAAIFGDQRIAVGIGGAEQQEGGEDRQQDAERNQDALAPQQRTPRRRRLIIVVVDHSILPDPACNPSGRGGAVNARNHPLVSCPCPMVTQFESKRVRLPSSSRWT